jgi:uncharacterized protein (DUF1778 family)
MERERDMPVAEHTPTPTKARGGARLEARVSAETKALCQKAAAIQGSTLTEFVVNCAVEAAKRTVRENEFVELTHRDRVAFVEALLNARSPNAKLKKAAQRHAQMLGG